VYKFCLAAVSVVTSGRGGSLGEEAICGDKGGGGRGLEGLSKESLGTLLLKSLMFADTMPLGGDGGADMVYR
jgi:hypothetical protein